MTITDLPTPCVLIEKKRLELNLKQMQEKANLNQVNLRPHTKTHKSPVLAKMQLDLGASGITVAKTGEAEVYAEKGFKDIRIAYDVVGDEKYQRILNMMDKVRVTFCVDTLEGAEAASHFFDAAGKPAEVLVEVDTGYGRCGVRWDWDQSVEFVKTISELPGLKLAGILTHAGNSYAGPKDGNESMEASLRRVSNEERDRMLDFASKLHKASVKEVAPNAENQSESKFEISIGSTPSMKYFENSTHEGFTITEIRPGNYVFLDGIQVGLEVAALKECALTVRAAVTSKQRNSDGSERLFLDGGRKVFTSDQSKFTEGYGIMLYSARTMNVLPHAAFTGLSEEHGWVKVPGASTLEVGNTVRVVPIHACVVVNNFSELYLVDGEEVVDTLKVEARGRLA